MKKATSAPPNPLAFWFYFFTLSVSLLTLILVTVSDLSTNPDPKSWFLTLPTNLRRHYSNGRTLKVQPTPHGHSVEVFAVQDGPMGSSTQVLIVHGLGASSYLFSKVVKCLGQNGVRALAIDLPGSGFSDKFVTVTESKVITGFARVLEMYNEIKDKGIFWGFDQLVEQGYVSYDHAENEVRVSEVKTFRALELGPDETGRVLGQVIRALGVGPVDLVLHDSAFNLGANWVSKNPGFVRSVTVLDGAAAGKSAFPLWVLKVPVVREVVSGFGFVFDKVVRSCCLNPGGVLDSVVEMGNRLNSSFDVGEWGKLNGVKDLPMQVIWSSGLSDEWTRKGSQVAEMLPQAKFVTHSGGCWPQDATADELAEHIREFVSRLPKPIKASTKEEPVPVYIREMIDEATANVHHHGVSDHDHNDHAGYALEVGYPTDYGLRPEF